MDKVRSKKTKYGTYVAQHRFYFLWFIPTPIWRNIWRHYGDVVLGDVFEDAEFETIQECENYLKKEFKD